MAKGAGTGEGQGRGIGEGEGQGMGKANLCPGILWAILWFLALVFIAWPVAIFVALVYILFLPFMACIDPCKGVCEFLLKGVQLPLTFAENMINMKAMCGK